MEITIGDLLNDAAARYRDRNFAVYSDVPFRVTYYEFLKKVNKIAKGLIKIGVKKGDHIAIWATNYPEWLLTMFASAKIGAVLVTVNTNYKTSEIEYILKQSDTYTLVMINGIKELNYNEIIQKIVPELKGSKPGEWKSKKLPELRNIININNENIDGIIPWNQLYQLAEDVSDEELERRERAVDPHDIASIQYTSGTTGFPKGAMLTHYNIINNALLVGNCMKFSEEDILCVTVQFFHCFGIVCSVLACVTHGSSMAPVEHFNPRAVIDTVIKEKCTALYGVPTMFISILSQPDFKEYNFSSLRTGIMAGSICPSKLMRQTVDELNMREITIAYGQTEAGPVCTQTTTSDSQELRVSTVGRALPFVECKIVDPKTGLECPPNVPGEFIAKGFGVMKGYYNMPEATARTIKHGWLHTGDLATCDENGYYMITGRIKDMVIRGGENIYPREIEEFLYTHPKISEVQVVGVPSEKYGEELFAYILPVDGETISEDEVREFASQNLAQYKTPRYIKTIQQFPMTASGKIQKYKLREMAAIELGLVMADSK
ncbi:MAG: AMP-binding protein [Oscillospiraceae bacterium]|nr:AMP-binding protein [Oscillospiraceae bacterium]